MINVLQKIKYPFIVFLAMLVSCTDRSARMYEALPPEQTGISFANNLIYSDSLSVLDFEYLFNGGGVAIGDINNDGLQDIYFTGNMTSGKLYLNKGNLHGKEYDERIFYLL